VTLTEQDLHLIELYLNGRLADADKVEFDNRMRSDEEFKAMVSQVRASVIGIRQSAIDEKMALLKEEEGQLDKKDVSSFLLTPMHRWMAVAAALIAVIIAITPLLRTDDTIKNAYLAEHFDEYILHETDRSENNSEKKVTPEQERAYNLYAMKKFHKAMPLLEELWEEERDTLALFYLGVGKLALNEEIIYDNLEYRFKNPKLDKLFKNVQVN